jgi:hypothetical protein
MLVKESEDVARLNELLNHPDIYPWVHGSLEGPMDITPITDIPSTIILEATTGMFLFVKKAPHVLEVHTQFLPGSTDTLDCAKDAAKWIFTNTDTKSILTMVPRHNPAARRLAKQVGFKYTVTDGEWPTDEGPVPMDHFELTKKTWRKTCPQPQ